MWRAEEGRGGYCESIGAEEDDWRGGRRAFGAARALATCASADDILEIVCGARGGDLTPSDVVTAAHELGKDARKASRALRGDARFLVLTDLIASPRADAFTWSDVAKVLNAMSRLADDEHRFFDANSPKFDTMWARLAAAAARTAPETNPWSLATTLAAYAKLPRAARAVDASQWRALATAMLRVAPLVAPGFRV